MEIQTRHRIIGIAVIFALILIFVPMLMSKKLEQNQVAPGIPTPPAAPQVIETAIPPAQNQMVPVPSDTNSGEAAQPALVPVEQQVCSPDSEDCSMAVTTSGNSGDESADDNINDNDQDATTDDDNDADLPALPEEENAPVATTPSTVSPAPAPQLSQPQNVPAVQPVEAPKLQSDNTPAQISNVALEKTVSAPAITVPVIKKPVQKHAMPIHRQTMVKAPSSGAAWMVQVGLFSDAKNADGLIHRLHQKGFTAFGYLVESPQGTATHVYVGPSTDYDKAKIMQSRLQTEMGIKGYVTQFNASSFQQ
jgi:DedD protein